MLLQLHFVSLTKLLDDHCQILMMMNGRLCCRARIYGDASCPFMIRNMLMRIMVMARSRRSSLEFIMMNVVV